MDKQQIIEVAPPPGLSIRYTVPQDAEWIRKWFHDPSVIDAFPMCNDTEIDDAVRRWVSFSRIRASLTVELDGHPVGIATLYIQTYKRIAHQTEFGIIVDENYRGRGVGGFLLTSLMKLARDHFHIELIHLQVYENNPAIPFYERYGFKEFGRQKGWMKKGEGFVGRVFMERFI
jgi:ribosomal protein S18 acetylase RimI-like enzyme